MPRLPKLKLPKSLPSKKRSASREKKLSILDLPRPKNSKNLREEEKWRKKSNRKLRKNSMRSFKGK